MTYKETLNFIKEADWKGSRLGLERVRELLFRLGDPQKKLRFIHVAGTNGKGSTCALLSSVLKAAGYRTGLCISPHLSSYNERMQVDGECASDDDMCRAAEIVKKAMAGMEDVPTEFERVLAMSMVFFLDKACDIVILEVGLGGRLDATNVIDAPILSIITHIAYDHVEILGDTLTAIAREKAGIIKPGTKALMYGQSHEVETLIRDICTDLKVPLFVSDTEGVSVNCADLSGQNIDYKTRHNMDLALIGEYQPGNAALALDAVDILRDEGFSISEEAVREGLSSAKWPGRFECIMNSPVVIVDGAHNIDGALALKASIERYLTGRKAIFVMSVMKDKPYRDMIRLMAPFASAFIATAPDYDRALLPKDLAAVMEEVLASCQPGGEEDDLPAGGETDDIPVYHENRAGDAVKRAIAMTGDISYENDAVIVFGSLYQVGEVRDALS